jgi:hypothetical protein
VSNETKGYVTAEELSQVEPVHGDSRIIISYDKETVEHVMAVRAGNFKTTARTPITDAQYEEIKKRVESDDGLWQYLFELVEQVGNEVIK